MEICADSFLINLLGNLICTLKIKNPETVQAVYGPPIAYSKTFIYTPGTGTDPTHPNFGFRVEYSPSPGNPPTVPPDANFPAGVTLAPLGGIGAGFDRPPDLSGNLTEAKEATFSGAVAMDRDTYAGGQSDVLATIIYNPGI